MTMQQVTILRSDGEREAFQLDTEAELAAVRAQLEDWGFMHHGDYFMFPIYDGDEAGIPLARLVGEEGRRSALMIGNVRPDLGEDRDGDDQRFDRMSAASKLELFRRLGVYHGLTASAEDGFNTSAKPCVSPWHEEDLPASTRPPVSREITTDQTFHKESRLLKLASFDEGSVSLSTHYGGGAAGFEYARSRSQDSETVKEFLIGKILVKKVEITVDPKNLQLTGEFEESVKDALLKDTSSKGAQACNLVKTLNQLGYFVPRVFTLGGALATEKTADVTDLSQADTESREFRDEVQAAYEGISGGANGDRSESREEPPTEIDQRTPLTFDQIGGRKGTCGDFPKFLDSLDSSINWQVISCDELVPTVALISDRPMRRLCLQLLDNYGTYPEIIEEQPLIDLLGYATRAQVAVEERA